MMTRGMQAKSEGRGMCMGLEFGEPVGVVKRRHTAHVGQEALDMAT
jgi:hypothetical protein